MEKNVVNFEPTVNTYISLADKCSDKGDFSAALGYLFEAEKISPDSPDVLSSIADAYADLDMLELSNQYWFYYIDRAPKDKQSVAFEELAVNYFYMNKVWAAGYWFHQKLARDGFISQEVLDSEISDFFSEEGRRRDEFRIVYPYNHTDYSSVLNKARSAFAEDNPEAAIELLESVPEEYRNAELSGDLAFYYFIDKRDNDMLKESRSSLKHNGENVSAYSNLVAYYNEIKDYDKRDYYYKKLIACRPSNPADYVRLATSAMDDCDHVRVVEYAEKAIKDRKYDFTLRFMTFIAQVNLEKFDDAEKTLTDIIRLYPHDTVNFYYFGFIKRLKNGDKEATKLLPLPYVKDLPPKTINSYVRLSRDYHTGKKVSNERLKLLKDISVYGEDSSEPMVVKSVFIPYCTDMRADAINGTGIRKRKYERLFKALLKTEIPADAKGMILHTAITCGVKFRFGMVTGIYYVEIKPVKTAFDGQPDGALFTEAYADTVVKLALSGAGEDGRIGAALNDVYVNYKTQAEELGLSSAELSAIAVFVTNFFVTLGKKDVCALFKADYKRTSYFLDHVMKHGAPQEEGLFGKIIKQFKGMIEND